MNMDTCSANKIQLNQLITNSVEKLVNNIAQLNEERKVASKTVAEQFSHFSSSLGTDNQKNPTPGSSKKSLAFIEAQDMNEMNSVIEALKKQFPNVSLHLCTNEEHEGAKK